MKVGLFSLEQPDFMLSNAPRLHRFECSGNIFPGGACPQTSLVSEVFSVDNSHACIMHVHVYV